VSRVIDHDLTSTLDGHSWTVEFPVLIDSSYKNSRYEEHGLACHGYAADAPFIATARRSIPLRQTLRYRGQLPTLRTNYSDDNDTEFGVSAAGKSW